MGFKIEGKNENQCLVGPRMDDHGTTDSSNILVRNFFFPRPPGKHDDQYAFKKALNINCGCKAVSWTSENKNSGMIDSSTSD